MSESMTGLLPITDRIVRTGYIPPEKYKRLLTEDERQQVFRHREVWWWFIEPQMNVILVDLLKRFPDKKIGVRSVVTSLDGDVEVSDGAREFVVLDINKQLEVGSEYEGRKWTKIASIESGDTEMPERTVQFTSYYRSVYAHTAEPSRQKIAPAIAVYDLEKLRPVDPPYLYELPEDLDTRKGIILAIYPINVEPMRPSNPIV